MKDDLCRVGVSHKKWCVGCLMEKEENRMFWSINSGVIWRLLFSAASEARITSPGESPVRVYLALFLVISQCQDKREFPRCIPHRDIHTFNGHWLPID